MAKCFFTGVELPAHEMYVLDTAAVRRALRDLQKRIAAVDRLMLQLNVKDDAKYTILEVINQEQLRSIGW